MLISPDDNFFDFSFERLNLAYQFEYCVAVCFTHGDLWNTYVSQGRIATRFRCDGMLITVLQQIY